MSDLRRGRWLVRRVYKRGNIWYAHIRDTRDGRVRRISTKCTRKRWAEESIEGLLDELEAREKLGVRAKVPPFEDAFRKWIGGKSIRPKTQEGYEYDLKGAYMRFFAGPVNEITPEDAHKFLTAYKDRSKRTQQKHISCLRSFFKWARGMGYTDQDPLEIAPKIRRGEPKRDHVLTFDEARALLRASEEEFIIEKVDAMRPGGWKERRAPAADLFPAVLVGLLAGLRKTTLFQITMEEVDLEAGRLDIPGSMMKAGRAHTMPLHPALVGVLRGRQLPLSVHPRSLKRAAERAQIPYVTWRSLRRTFASWVQAKCSYACLKALMAHALDADVTGIYVEVSWPEKVQAIEALPDLLTSARILHTKHA